MEYLNAILNEAFVTYHIGDGISAEVEKLEA